MNQAIKLLSDSAIVINRVAQILAENNITYRIKDNVESARLAGFGISQNAVDLFIQEEDLIKAEELIRALLTRE